MKKTMLFFLTIFMFLSVNRVNAGALFKADDNVNLEKPINGTAFVAGNNVSVNNSIDGIGFIAGNNIKINYEQEYVLSAGNDIVLTSDITKDIFLAGANIEIKGSNIKRDAYIAAGDIKIDGNVGRNLYLTGETVELSGTYNGNIYVSADKLDVKDGTIINGTIKYNDDAIITGLKESVKTKLYNNNRTKKKAIKSYLYSNLSSYVHVLAVALVLVYLFEKLINDISKQTEDINIKDVLLKMGKGFLIMIGVPIVSIMLMITGVFVSVSVISFALYLMVLYISNILSGYVLASVIDKKYLKRNLNNYAIVSLGLLILYLLRLVPVIGGLISLVSFLYGIGYIGDIIIKSKRQ